MASIYQLSTLAAAIAKEARVGTDGDWPIVIYALIEEVLINAVVRDKPREFRKGGVSITVVVGEITLPDDFLIPERLEYTSGGFSWELFDELYPVCPARVQGKPASFKFVRDAATGFEPRLILYPPYASGGDTLLIDYYYRPNVSADADPIQYERVIPSLKQEVLQRLQIIQNKPADQLAMILQQYVMASRKDLTEDEKVPTINTQAR